jgi:ApaG protein
MSQYEFTVSAETRYLPEQSDPDAHQYAFAYTLTIRNTGEIAAQLISRHWIITDSDNVVQEVKGLGVVGNQPLLPPGEKFEYTSWAVIATPVGSMRGSYFCVAEDCERFEVPIPEFSLHMPRTLH